MQIRTKNEIKSIVDECTRDDEEDCGNGPVATYVTDWKEVVFRLLPEEVAYMELNYPESPYGVEMCTVNGYQSLYRLNDTGCADECVGIKVDNFWRHPKHYTKCSGCGSLDAYKRPCPQCGVR